MNYLLPVTGNLLPSVETDDHKKEEKEKQKQNTNIN